VTKLPAVFYFPVFYFPVFYPNQRAMDIPGLIALTAGFPEV
jgi:hypothetical protein